MNGRAIFILIPLLILIYVTQGCGGGGDSSDDPTNSPDTDNSDNPVDTTSNGYNGSEEQAVINESNVKDLTIGAASSAYSGFDGREVSVTDENSSAYLVSARIYDPFHGYIDVTTEIPFILDCSNERPGSGRLNFIGAS